MFIKKLIGKGIAMFTPNRNICNVPFKAEYSPIDFMTKDIIWVHEYKGTRVEVISYTDKKTLAIHLMRYNKEMQYHEILDMYCFPKEEVNEHVREELVKLYS